MITVRQLERLWKEKDFGRMARLCMEMRPEASPRLAGELARPTAAAAIALIRLDELHQTHAHLCITLLHAILAAQERDGGWGDPLISALCLRALMASRGQGPAIDRGLAYLASLQKTSGAWPRIPIRRLPADPFVSAFVLFQLAHEPRFAAAVRLDHARAWFAANQPALDHDTLKLWRITAARLAARATPRHAATN